MGKEQHCVEQQIWVRRKKYGNPYSFPYSFTHVTITARARKFVIIIIASINRTQVVTSNKRGVKTGFADHKIHRERETVTSTDSSNSELGKL